MSVIAKHNDIPFHVGDTIRVHYRIIEKEKIAGKTKKSVKEEIKERVQPFEGVVMGVRGVAENKSFTVRRIGADNIGIERVFPLISPWIEKVEVMRKGFVRRAKLYYLRGKTQLDVKQPVEAKTTRKARRGRSSSVSSKKRVSRP